MAKKLAEIFKDDAATSSEIRSSISPIEAAALLSRVGCDSIAWSQRVACEREFYVSIGTYREPDGLAAILVHRYFRWSIGAPQYVGMGQWVYPGDWCYDHVEELRRLRSVWDKHRRISQRQISLGIRLAELSLAV